MEALNLNNLTVDSNGRVIFSGLSSGIDAQGIVTDIIAAKRLPIDSIENRIAENADQIAALGDLRALRTGLRRSLYSLRGAVTLGNAGDVFSAKQVFATTSRSDGALPSAAGNLVGVSTTNATAHKVASKAFSSDVVALSLSGTFDATGKGGSATITVSSTDTLQDLRDRINNANTGVNGTWVALERLFVGSRGLVELPYGKVGRTKRQQIMARVARVDPHRPFDERHALTRPFGRDQGPAHRKMRFWVVGIEGHGAFGFTTDVTTAANTQAAAGGGDLVLDGAVPPALKNFDAGDLNSLSATLFKFDVSATGNAFRQTDRSGDILLQQAAAGGSGSVASSALESSTVDLAEEFTKMITTQRAYSAAAKIITTADEMLEELIRIRR